VITHGQGTYYIECDRCHHQQTTRATAIVMAQFRTMAKGWGWSFDTEHGDLCRACSKEWRLGRLDVDAV
jgi:hypothetical protein